MTTLLPEINVEVTKKNARNVLRQYSRLEREAGKNYSQRLTVEITDMPRGSASIRNTPVESMVVDRVTAETKCWDILQALFLLPRISREVLWYAYIDKEHWSVTKIARALGYSDKAIEKYKSRALLEFAEAYQSKKLQVIKNQS